MKISNEVKFLEDAFDILNKKYFESVLSKCAITIQSTPIAHGHFTPWEAWSDSENDYNEINLGAESLKRPVAEIIATLVHEMVHYYCHANGIKDTSRGGTYHNKRFKEEAEKRGLIIGYSSRIGHSETTPSEELKSFVHEMQWEEKIKLYRHFGGISAEVPAKSKSSTRKYKCPCCGMSVRATKEVRVLCMDCNEQMELAE